MIVNDCLPGDVLKSIYLLFSLQELLPYCWGKFPQGKQEFVSQTNLSIFTYLTDDALQNVLWKVSFQSTLILWDTYEKNNCDSILQIKQQ